MFIITKKPDEVYNIILKKTNHDATLFKGVGCYKNEEKAMLYSVVNSDATRVVIMDIKKEDPDAFINYFGSKRNSWKVLLSEGIKNKKSYIYINMVGYFWYDKPMKQRNTKQREVADMNLVTSKRKLYIRTIECVCAAVVVKRIFN